MADEVTVSEETQDDQDAFELEFFSKTTPPKEVDEVLTIDKEEDVTPDDDSVDPEKPEVEDDGEDEAPAPEPKKKQTAQERISELTAARKEAERKANALEARLKALEAKPAEAGKDSTKEDTGPTPDDEVDGEAKYPLGEFDPNYIRDLTRFTLRQESEALKAEAQKADVERQHNAVRDAVINEWEGKLIEAEETIPDIRTKAASLEDTFSDIEPNYGEYLAMTIMSLEHGPEVLNYLADNPQEAKNIVAMGATKATLALGRLEAGFDKPAEAPRGRTSNAPTPPPRNRGGSTGRNISPTTENLDEFEKLFFKK